MKILKHKKGAELYLEGVGRRGLPLKGVQKNTFNQNNSLTTAANSILIHYSETLFFTKPLFMFHLNQAILFS